MSYKEIANTIKTKLNNFVVAVTAIDYNCFDTVWQGDAHTNLKTKLKSTVDNYNIEAKQINEFILVLEQLQQYKDNKEKLTSLQSSLSNLDNTTENANTINSLKSSISSLENVNSVIKSEINKYLASFNEVSTNFEVITYEPTTDYVDYIVDLNSLYSLFASDSLKQIPDGSRQSLYDYYSKELVYEKMAEIQSQYSGRNAAVNSALGIIQMAAEVNKKLNYTLRRGTNSLMTLDEVVSGADCCTFASWAISRGSDKVDKTFSTSEFVNLGTKIDYSQAQVGDVFTLKYSGRGGHVMLVVENHPETNSALVAEAGGEDRGVVLTEIKYSVLQDKKYSARDLTEFYT